MDPGMVSQWIAVIFMAILAGAVAFALVRILFS
jgi:hypothetical protein